MYESFWKLPMNRNMFWKSKGVDTRASSIVDWINFRFHFDWIFVLDLLSKVCRFEPNVILRFFSSWFQNFGLTYFCLNPIIPYYKIVLEATSIFVFPYFQIISSVDLVKDKCYQIPVIHSAPVNTGVVFHPASRRFHDLQRGGWLTFLRVNKYNWYIYVCDIHMWNGKRITCLMCPLLKVFVYTCSIFQFR